MKNKVIFNNEKMLEGMDIVYKAVSSTLGSAGRNVVFRDFGGPKITNDGVSVANRINLEDDEMSIGADLLRQAAQKTDSEAGDGTTTAITLTYNMIQEGLKKVKTGVSPMVLRREMEQALPLILSEIVPNNEVSDEDLLNIAKISVEDDKIAELVKDSVKEVGEDGEVVVEESNKIKIEVENIKGYKLDRGFVSPYMVTDTIKMEAVLEKVPVLVTDKNLSITQDIFPLIEEVHKRGHKQLVIFAGEIQGELLATLIANKMQGTFNVVVVNKPYSKEVLEDVALVCKTVPLTEEKGIKKFTAEHYSDLGMIDKIIVNKDSTLIINDTNVDERINTLKEELKGAEEYELRQLKSRISRLAGKVVNIKVGASSEAEMQYLKLKIDDAVNAVKAASQTGIVIGGGRTLFDISMREPQTAGEEVIRNACGFPIRKIIENSGYDVVETIKQICEQDNLIFNSSTGAVERNSKIIDPAKVELCAVKNAVSLAGIFLTVGSVIVDLPEKKVV